MAVTISAKIAALSGRYREVYDVTASADADTTAVIVHGLDAAPAALEITLIPTDPVASISLWSLTAGQLASASKTDLSLTKGIGVGSGKAAVQLRVIVAVQHTIVK